MRALTFQDGRVQLEERPRPVPGDGEALIALRRAGICSTDLHIMSGYMDYQGVLGHEFVGEVVSCAEPAWLGRRVVGEINLPCRQCEMCTSGHPRHCPTRTVLGILGKDGCFADYLTLPIANLHPIPDELSDECAVFAEPTAAAFEILEQTHWERGTRAAVLGDGKLGSLCAQVLHAAGLQVTLFGRHPHKLQVAAERGIRTQLASTPSVDRFPLVVEATGSEGGFGHACRMVQPRGTLVLKSTFNGQTNINTAPLVVDEITLLGSRCGPFEPAIEALTRGEVDPTPLIDATYSLTQGIEALQRAATKGVAKVLLRP